MAMKIDLKNPPRSYEVGRTVKLKMKDCGTVRLEPDEQLTFTTEAGAEYDLARKDWGFYATPSLNGRLQQFGLRAVLVKNMIGRFFVLLVESGKESLFDQYVAVEELRIIAWLDNSENLALVESALQVARNP
jgi:hypothetical protein